MDFIKEAISQNIHWETGKIEFPRVTNAIIERDIFPTLENAVKTKFMIVLRGLRRVGKSVITRQLMQKLIQKGMSPNEIGWFEFDRSMRTGSDELNSLISFFKSKGSKVIIFDEIMFVKDWQDVLKRHYDLSDIKFIVTGSSALELDRRSSESLAGRLRLIKINPFSFREYLNLKGMTIPLSDREMITNEQKMIIICEEYIKNGGLPEAELLENKDREKYIRNSLLDPLFFKDIPAIFPRANHDMLMKTLELAAATSGSVFQYQSMAQILGCSHPVVSEQLEILKRSLSVWQIYNYTKSVMKQKRTAKKIIFTDNGILKSLNPDITLGALAENSVGQWIDAAHFWRDAEGREVDFLIPQQKIAMEVKYQEHIVSSDEKNLRYFLERNKGWKGILITKKHDYDGDILHVPLWKFLLKPWV
ncbi:MAG: ATP-binding protein [Candidatus Micrarchaeota archaeon]|nr:ATP-binding protein [Candidatus Micrarchaeota archaeon]